MDTISNVTLSPRSELVLYADDMSLSKAVLGESDLVETQNDVDAIKAWADTNYLTSMLVKPSLCSSHVNVAVLLPLNPLISSWEITTLNVYITTSTLG